jgi:hypothetical protein
MAEGAIAALRGVRLVLPGRRTLVWFLLVPPVLYFAALAALYHWQRDLLFMRVAWWDGGAPPEGYIQRVVQEPDGTHLRIWQSGPPDRGKPTLVFFYGNAGTLWDFAQIGEELHAQGYGVVLGSYRGYSRNPGNPSERGLFADARAILGAVPKDYGPVVVWGQSLGTGVAARMAAEGRVSGLILQSPYTSIVDVAAMEYPIFPVRLLDKDPFDTLALVPKIRMPVLVIHGTDDRTVPFWMGQRVAHGLGREATFVPVEHRGHGDLTEAVLVSIANKWLKAHAGAIAHERVFRPS